MKTTSHHDAIAGARGEVDVLGVAGDAAVPPLDVAGHVLQHAVDALAGTVGAWGRGKGHGETQGNNRDRWETERGRREGERMCE